MRCLYLHGFASGPESTKGVAFAEDFGRRGVEVERLDLRVPSLEHLRPSAIIDHVVEAIGDRGPVVLIGSSLGGLTAARVAARSSSVRALVLLAPAFRLIERWRERLGEEAWQAWQRDGWLAIHDHATKREARVDFGFAADAMALDAMDGGWPPPVVPTWVAHGRGDDTVDIALSRAWAQGVAAGDPARHVGVPRAVPRAVATSSRRSCRFTRRRSSYGVAPAFGFTAAFAFA
jgi:predicted esterase YcpF (UPF0227 family)